MGSAFSERLARGKDLARSAYVVDPTRGRRREVFSGTATYRKTLDVPVKWMFGGPMGPKGPMGPNRRHVYLDLGRVEVMAQVKLNDHDLGILWKPPFRVDVTDALRPGKNTLEIRLSTSGRTG